MEIDSNLITNKFISIAKTAIGSLLSSVVVNGSPSPAVVRARGSKHTPDTPYLVIDLLDRESISKHGMASTIDVTNKTEYHRLESFLYSFRCYGTNALSIIDKLHIYFDIPAVRDDIRKITGGAIRSIGEIDPSSLSVADIYVETAAFTFVWVSDNSILDPDSGIIETVVLTYEY